MKLSRDYKLSAELMFALFANRPELLKFAKLKQNQKAPTREAYNDLIDLLDEFMTEAEAQTTRAENGEDEISRLHGVISRVLSNASTWCGPEAKRIKAELKLMLKSK